MPVVTCYTPEKTSVKSELRSLSLRVTGAPGGLGCSTQSCRAQRGGSPASVVGAERGLAVRPSLESLLAASSHMLKEVLDSPFVDPLKSLRLPRELNPNKKYSWMQKKEERVRRSGLCGGAETVPPETTLGLGWPGAGRAGPGPAPTAARRAVLASCGVFLGLGLPVGASRGGSLTGGRGGLAVPLAPGGLGSGFGL